MQKTHKKSSRPPEVAVLVDTATLWGRELISGVNNYSRKHGPWHLQVEPRGRDDPMILPLDWNGDGIIARVSTEKIAADLQSRKVPIVNISGIELKGFQGPRVSNDYEATAVLAIEHFRSRGFQRFAYVGPLGLSYVRKHAASFQRQIGDEMTLETFDFAFEKMAGQRWLKQRNRFGDWLKSLQKPIAVFSWGTSASCQLLDTCRYWEIVVPDEVAVLAGANDDVISAISVPAMSAVLNPSLQQGYQAAKVLDEMMHGAKHDGLNREIPPIEIITRGSTEIFAIEDEELSAAVQYMRKNAFSELTVAQVADSVPMTRRSLERKFHEWIGRTPLDQIHRLRIARVKELLATTDLPISQVASSSGYGTPDYMTVVFKKETGLTPLLFRTQTRAR